MRHTNLQLVYPPIPYSAKVAGIRSTSSESPCNFFIICFPLPLIMFPPYISATLKLSYSKVNSYFHRSLRCLSIIESLLNIWWKLSAFLAQRKEKNRRGNLGNPWYGQYITMREGFHLHPNMKWGRLGIKRRPENSNVSAQCLGK